MANIHTKEHVFVIVKGKNGLERREVKQTADYHKLTDKLKSRYEISSRAKKSLDK